MKRILLLLVLSATTLWSCAQTVVQRAGSANTVNDPRHMASLNSFQPTYADTTEANLYKGVDSVGAIIYTYDVKGFWYRQHNPKRWVRFSDLAGQGTVQNITVISDSSVRICTGEGACDTLNFDTHIINITSTYFLTDSTIVLCNLSQCDTVQIPRQPLYLFQNGLTRSGNITELGGTLLHPTVVEGEYQSLNLKTNLMAGEGFSYEYFNHRLHLGASGGGLHTPMVTASAPTGTPMLIRANSANDNMVAFENTADTLAFNADSKTLIGLFGATDLRVTNPTGIAIKVLGMEGTLQDSAGASTFYGLYIDPVLTGNTQFYSLYTDTGDVRLAGTLTFKDYPSSRNDGVLTKALATDAQGRVILGTIPEGSLANQNVGAAYRLLIPSTQQIKTLRPVYGIVLDSIVSGEIALRIDTTTLSTLYALRDTARAIRSTYKFNNGLTDSLLTGQVGLGGTLVKLTTIDAGSANKLTLSGTATNPNYLFNVIGGTAGLYAAGSNLAAQFVSTNTSASAYARTLVVQRSGPVGATAGFGAKIDMEALNASGSNKLAGSFGFRWTNSTAGAESARMEWALMNAGATEARKMALEATGKLTLDTYGDGLHTGTATYALASDVNGNVIEVPLGGGGAITADNGLEMSTATNAQLGGTLLKNTTIDALAYNLILTGTNNTGYGAMRVINTGDGRALHASAVNSDAIQAVSTNGAGVSALSTGGVALSLTSTNNRAATMAINPASFDTPETILELLRYSSGTAASGIGGSIDFNLQRASGGGTVATRLVSVWNNATSGSQTGQFEVWNRVGGAIGRKMAVTPAGTLILSGVAEYTDNAAAVAAGLEAGTLYHTAGVVKIVYAP